MSGFGDAVKYLYNQFILRDVLSFITPGAIVVFTAILLLLTEPDLGQGLRTVFRYSTSFHWLLYIPLFGLFYAVGYAIQSMLALLGCIRLHRLDKGTPKQRFKLLWLGWQDREDYLKCARKRTIRFSNVTANVGWANQIRERAIVLKQMGANVSGAIVIASVFIGISFSSCVTIHVVIFSIVAFILILSLFWGYRSSEFAVDTIEEEIIQFDKNRELNEDK